MRNAKAAGSLHEINRQIKYLARTWNWLKQGIQGFPSGIMRVNNFCISVQAKDQRACGERAEHDGHSRILLNMRGGLISAAGDVQPDDSILIDHSQGVHALRRNINPAIGSW